MILPCGRANVESGSIFGNKYSARSGLHISLLCKEISTEGRVELLEGLIQLTKVLGAYEIAYCGHLLLELIATILICRYPELSNEKVKYITEMISKNKFKSKSK